MTSHLQALASSRATSSATFSSGIAPSLRWRLDATIVKHGLPLERYLARIHDEERHRVARSIFDVISADLAQQEEFRIRSVTEGYLGVISYGRSFNDGAGNPLLFSGIVIPAPEAHMASH